MSADRVMDMYYEDIRKVQLLTAPTEQALFARYRTCPNPKCKTVFTAGATQTHCAVCNTRRDFAARELLVKGTLRFVVKVAKSYAKQLKGYWDRDFLVQTLISAGNLGILTAIDRFDIAKETRFLTYAAWWIREKILEELDHMGLVRVPAYKQKLLRASWKKQTHSTEGETPFVVIEDLTGLDDEIQNDAFEDTLLNTYGADALWALLRKLNIRAREQYIILAYYGVREDPKNLRQISERLGISPERVRQLKSDAMRALKDYLDDLEIMHSKDVFAD